MSLEFFEIEHKFVVSSTYDAGALRRRLQRLKPLRQTRVRVRDTYYASQEFPGKVFRHRFDRELQHFTLKTKGIAADARLEVNIELGESDQASAVEAFLQALGRFRKVTVAKQVQAFYFRDCEIVFYKAQCGPKALHCVEFEATTKSSLVAARKVIQKYETACGFDARDREPRSLFELLVVPRLQKPKKSPTKSRNQQRQEKRRGDC